MPAASLASLLISASLSAFGLPLGLPPAEEDPLMAKIAPPECAVYITWAGTAAPQPGSANAFEQFLLDKEVVRSSAEIHRVVSRLMEIGIAKAPEEQRPMIEKMVVVAHALIKQPGAVFVQLQPGKDGRPPEVRVGVVVKVGEKTADLKELLEHGLNGAPPGMVEKFEIEGRKFVRSVPRGNQPPVAFGFVGQYAVLGIGPNVIEGVLERAKASPPQWLLEAQQRLKVERRSSLAVINLKSIMALSPPPSDDDLQVLRTLGVDRLNSVESVTGLDATGVVTRTVLRMDGPRSGIFQLLEGPGVTVDDFKTLPANTLTTYALRFDAPAIFDLVREAAQPKEGANEFDAALAKFKENSGIDFRQELLPAFGNKLRTWTAPQAIPTGAPAAILSVDIKDRSLFEKLNEEIIKRMPLNGNPQVTFSKEKIGNVQTFTLQIAGPVGATSICWAILNDRIVLTTRPRLLREQVEQPADFQSVAASPELAAALKANPKASVVVFEDSAKIYKLIYNLIGVGLPFAAQAAPEWTADLSLDLLPDPESLAKVLKPSITTIGMSADGLEVQTRTTVPFVSVSSMTPVLIALLLPAVQAARSAARRMQTANNLKQIGLGMHNYQSTHNTFPPAFSKDKNGKPLHSWRVLILPFMEENALYEKLKLDEPWDSDHNLPLLKEARIQVYMCPADPPSSKTRFQTVRTEKSIFPGAVATEISQVKDGLSNTAMVVETSPAKAVEWFKPDDFVPDEKDPAAGLRGAWPGGFHVGLADGSVRFVSDLIDGVMLQRLFEKADGNVLDFNELDGANRNGGFGPAAPQAPAPPRRVVPEAAPPDLRPEPAPRGVDAPRIPRKLEPSR